MAALHCISSVLAALDTAAPVSRVSEEAVARVKWFLATTCPAQQVHCLGCTVVTIVRVSPRVQHRVHPPTQHQLVFSWQLPQSSSGVMPQLAQLLQPRVCSCQL